MQFLSEAWFGAADRAVQAAAPTAPASPLTIDQFIEDAVAYRVTIARDSASLRRIDDADRPTVAADAAFTQSLATARALASGATDAHQAFLLGEITFTGDIDALIAGRDALSWLEATLAPVMAATSFEP